MRILTERDNCVSLWLETLEKILMRKDKAVKRVIQSEALPTFIALLSIANVTTKTLVFRCVSHKQRLTQREFS